MLLGGSEVPLLLPALKAFKEAPEAPCLQENNGNNETYQILGHPRPLFSLPELQTLAILAISLGRTAQGLSKDACLRLLHVIFEATSRGAWEEASYAASVLELADSVEEAQGKGSWKACERQFQQLQRVHGAQGRGDLLKVWELRAWLRRLNGVKRLV